MRIPSGIAMLALLATLVLQTAAQTPASGSVRGVVLRLESGSPLDNAQVVLVPHDDTSRPRAVETDSTGIFEFAGIPPGAYSVEAQRTGFFGPLEHDVAANVVAKDVVVTAQQTQQISLGMMQGGAINGRVVDSRGIPAAKARVMAIRTIYRNGQRSWYSSAFANADENGNYRLFWLGVGNYFIYAKANLETSPGTDSTDSATFYPGTNDLETATPVALREGAELTGMNVRLQQTATATLQIRVADESGVGKQATFTLVSHDRILVNPNLGAVPARVMSPRGENGDYEMRGVRPGSYDLIARGGSGGVGGVGAYDGRASIRVGGGGTQRLTIVVKPTVPVTARFVIAGNSAIDLDKLALELEQRDRVGYRLRPHTDSDVRGAIRFGPVPPSTAVPVIYGPYPDAYVADILQDGRSVFDRGLVTIEDRPVSVDILLNGDGARIEGSVQGAPSTKVESTRVVLIPEPPRRANSLLYQVVNPDANGKFTMRGVAPGNYKVFAWENAPASAWENTEFVAPFERQGKALRVDAGIPASVSVDWIPKTTTPLLPLIAPSAPGVPANAITSNVGGVIEGIVVRKDNGAPIGAARLSLQLGPSPPPSTTTDPDGRFRFPNIAPGAYRVDVQHDAFLSGPASTQHGGVTSLPVVMNVEFHANNLKFTLVPGAVITGRILSPEGQPLARHTVQVLMMGNPAFNATRRITNSTRTDDRGQFRFARLEPAQYAIAVTPQPGLPGAKDDYARTYYPGTIDSTRAAPITLTAGMETDVELRMQTGPVASISGKVDVDLAGNALPNNGRVSLGVTLTSFSTDAFGERLLRVVNYDESGRFLAKGMPPGRYALHAALNSAPGTPRYQGRTIVDLGSRDMTDVAVVIRAGVDVQIELQRNLLGEPVLVPRTSTSFELHYLDAPDAGLPLTGSGLGNSNRLIISNVPAGLYSLEIPTLGGHCVKDVLQSGVSVFERGIRIEDNSPASLQIVLQPLGAPLNGVTAERTTQRCIGQ